MADRGTSHATVKPSDTFGGPTDRPKRGVRRTVRANALCESPLQVRKDGRTHTAHLLLFLAEGGSPVVVPAGIRRVGSPNQRRPANIPQPLMCGVGLFDMAQDQDRGATATWKIENSSPLRAPDYPNFANSPLQAAVLYALPFLLFSHF